MSNDLRVALIHYHLQPGGVTKVLTSAARALCALGVKVAVFCGNAGTFFEPGVVCVTIPGLSYDEEGRQQTAASLRAELVAAARAVWGSDPNIWHIHNHALGRNLALVQVVTELAREGAKILLHLHDFAEDLRTVLYRRMVTDLAAGDHDQLGALLYPQSSNVHYAVLNSRDRTALLSAGFRGSQVHLVPNPVDVSPCDVERREKHPLILYPARGIRRKNLGEFLFWVTVGGSDLRWMTTLAPATPVERASYDRWVAFAMQNKLPVEFEVGLRQPLTYWLSICQAVITTSIAEGFGLAYLEPWLSEIPVVGRDLPHVTVDMRESGVHFGSLYTHLPVPLKWIDAKHYRLRLMQEFRLQREGYGLDVEAEVEERLWEACATEEWVDFGRLDEVSQREVLQQLLNRGGEGLTEVKDFLSYTPWEASDLKVIHANAQCILRCYSTTAHAAQLQNIYAILLSDRATEVEMPFDYGSLRERFMRPENFYLLRL